MDNPYFTTVNPYFQQLSPKDEASLNPTFQNIGAQQAMQNAALKEQNQQVQQAGMIGKQGNQNQMALAMALRNQNNDPYFQAQQAMKQYGQGNVYGYGGQGQVPMGGTGFD